MINLSIYNPVCLCFSTPDKTADDIGMKELFKAVRTNACDIYRCKENKQTIITTPTPKVKEEKEQ
jgi:hypothetical protein